MASNLSDLIAILKGHRVFIQTHNFPDPDAIASAYGLQVLLSKFNINTVICHHGAIERTATANMAAEFGIELVSDAELADMSQDDYIITVDSQKGNANILDLVGDEVACIDHHPTFFPVEYKYKDIRTVGSCSTIIADYYRRYNLDMPDAVATALLYGLKMDTKDFTRGVTKLDVDMYAYLFPMANEQLIRRFQSESMQYSELGAFADSLNRIEITDGVAFVFLNYSCADAFLATISDFILNLDVVTFAVVYCKKSDGLKFSVRSELDELDAGKIISAALKNCGSGGGHRSMAGGFADEKKICAAGGNTGEEIKRLFLDEIKKAAQ